MNKIILDIYKRCDVKCFPLDCFKLLDTLGIKHKAYNELSEKKKASCLATSNDAFTAKGTIYYNDEMIPQRVRFSLMHELGHKVLNHAVFDDLEENEADKFAISILAPNIIIHSLPSRTNITYKDISSFFYISEAAANNALVDYKNWFKNIANSRSRKPTPEELEIEKIFVKPKPAIKKEVYTEVTKPRYLMDPANDYYFVQQMERRRTGE